MLTQIRNKTDEDSVRTDMLILGNYSQVKIYTRIETQRHQNFCRCDFLLSNRLSVHGGSVGGHLITCQQTSRDSEMSKLTNSEYSVVSK
jgi:hypothetical protein